MKEKKYYVYVHTNKINNKKYVGITSKTPNERWQNGNGYYGNKHFYSAIKKYGWEDGFIHEIICEGLNREEACKKEQELIALYNSNDPMYGYNHTIGGDTSYLEAFKKELDIKIDWNFKLPPYSIVKKDVYLESAFIGLVKLAKGHENEEVITKIWEENGVEYKREVETKKIYIEPRKDLAELLLKNYSNEEELQDLMNDLKKIVNGR